MNWDDIKRQKEDSIRESTGNPMSVPKQFKSYIEYTNSQEYQDFLNAEIKYQEEYALKAQEDYNQLPCDQKLSISYHVFKKLFENEFIDKGSYRHLIYTKLGLKEDSYATLMDSGLLNIHNSLYTNDELMDNLKDVLKELDIKLTNKEFYGIYNTLMYGKSNKKDPNQLSFDF